MATLSRVDTVRLRVQVEFSVSDTLLNLEGVFEGKKL